MKATDQEALGKLVELIGGLGKKAQEGQGKSNQEFKVDGSYVTEMDRIVESELRGFLHERFPQHRVLGEEGGFTGPEDGRYIWVIDPIDGTTNYIQGLPVWAVSVGLLEDGMPQWGCVYIPALDQLALAQVGRGATVNGKPVSPLERHSMEKEDLLGIASGSLRRYDYRFPQRVRAMGSAASQIVFVARGHLVGYFLDVWHVYDIAAALLIAREAGVRVTDDRGADFTTFTHFGQERERPLLFATPGIHDRLLSLIVPKGRDRSSR
jgi:myo-inositol-1(or 4)-monophosphatase